LQEAGRNRQNEKQDSSRIHCENVQHLYIAKYYDAKNGEQRRLPLKVAQNNVCSLPALTKAAKLQQQLVFGESAPPSCLDPKTDCATSRPKYGRSLPDKCLPLSRNLVEEKGVAERENEAHSIETQPSNGCCIASDRQSKPKYRSFSEVVAPKGIMLADESGKAQRRCHAWNQRVNRGKSSMDRAEDTTLKPFRPRSISQIVAPKLEDIAQEISKENAGTSAKDETAGIGEEKRRENPHPNREALIKKRKQFQRRLTVATETPSVRRESICRWHQTVKLVKDLPKSEQAEIFRGACFFRMAVPRFNSSTPAKSAEKPARQRKISTTTPPSGSQELTATPYCAQEVIEKTSHTVRET